jgi:hypothetical protein
MDNTNGSGNPRPTTTSSILTSETFGQLDDGEFTAAKYTAFEPLPPFTALLTATGTLQHHLSTTSNTGAAVPTGTGGH